MRLSIGLINVLIKHCVLQMIVLLFLILISNYNFKLLIYIEEKKYYHTPLNT